MRKLIIALATILMVACTNEKKALVLYYSQNGTTKAVAEEIQAQTGADICSFDVAQVYDGTFDETIARCLKEREDGYLPELVPLNVDLSKYDVIFLGYPVWFGTFAPPVKALLATEKFAGKTIVPFCTFGSGGLSASIDDLKSAIPEADIKAGYGVRTARIGSVETELNRFLIENGLKDGEVEPLPEYSEQTPVTEEEFAIFDAACSSYPYPMGTPVTAGMRKTPDGTDFLFISESLSPEGQVSHSKVYVTVQDGRSPEFTQVVR